MRLRVVLLAMVLMLLVAIAVPAFAQAKPAGEYPNVASMAPFSAGTNFMSLPGYLRWITWKDQGVWITYQEAERIVAAQSRLD